MNITTLPTPHPKRDWVVTICLLVLVVILCWSTLTNWFQQQMPAEMRSAQAALAAQQTDTARSYLDKALEEQRHDAAFYLRVCVLCNEYGAWSLLTQYAQEGLDRHSNAPTPLQAALYSMLAQGWAQQEPVGQQEKAILAAENALKLAPKDLQTQNQLGFILADNRRDLERATALLMQAVETANNLPNTPENRYVVGTVTDSYGWVLYQKGEFAKALQVLKSARDAIPEGTLTVDDGKVIYYHIGAAHQQLGQWEEARSALQVALRYDPQYAPAKQALGAIPLVLLPPR